MINISISFPPQSTVTHKFDKQKKENRQTQIEIFRPNKRVGVKSTDSYL